MAGLTSPRFQESPAAHSTLAVLLRDNKQSSENFESHYDSTPSSSLEMEEERIRLSVADSAKSAENSEQPYDLSIRKRTMSTSNCPDTPSHRPFANAALPLVSAVAQNGEYTPEASATAAHNGHAGKSDTPSHGRGKDDGDSTVGSMLRGMNQLRHKRLLCDVSFLLRGEEFHAHKAVMAACSEYCHERIIQLSECHSQTNQPLAITLSDALSCDGLRTLLDFVYTGKLDVNDDSGLLEETLVVANHLRVPKLVHACNQHRFATNNEAGNRRPTSSSPNPLRLKSEAPEVDSTGVSSPPSSLDLSGESCGLESKERCVDLYKPLQEAFDPTKPRRASESYASMLDDRERRERSWMLGQRGSIIIPPDEVVRILHHSKSEGETGNTSDHGSDLCSSGSGGRSSSIGLAKCEDGRRADVGADVYQPVHWKKREFNGRRAEKHQQQITHGNARSPFTPNGNTDEVFSDNESAASASAEFARRLSSSMAASAGAMKSYFPYAGFAPGRGSGGHLESLLPVPPYTDLTSPLIPSLFAFPFGSSGRNAALDAHSLSYLRNRAQSYDVNQHARFRRDAHPLLAPACGPIISSLLGHQQSPFHYPVPDRGIGSNGQVNGNNNNPPQRRKTTSPESNGLDRFLANKRQRSESTTNSFSPIGLNLNSTDRLPKQTSVGQANTSSVNGTARSNNDSSSYRLNNFLKKAPESGKPYKCLLCDANFNRPANLKTHMRIHSGEKPYKCENCGARFVQVAHLRAHILIHTGEKPYPCTVCGTKFRHLQTLKSHLRIHTGEKPYSCEQCSVQFRHKSQLRLHLRTKHGIQTNTKKTYKQVPGLSSADICAHIKRAQEAVKTQVPNKLIETSEMITYDDEPATSNNSFDNGFVQSSTSESVKCRSEEPTSGDPRPLGGNSGLFKINMKARLETIGENATRFDLPSLAMAGGHRVGINVP